MVFVVGSLPTITSISTKSLIFLILSGFATGASWICYFKALAMGDVNKVVPIDKSSTILTVLLAIVLCKDFSFGTVRNKIIAGKRRSSIYLSLFAVCALVLVSVILLSAFISLGVSLIFFDYQSAPFTFADFGYFMASLGFELLVLLFMAALLSWLCACMKNVGTAIVLYVAVTFLLMLVGSVVQVVASVLQITGNNQKLVDVLLFLDKINVGRAVAYIGAGTTYTWKDVLYLTLPSLAGICGFTGLGLWRFGKKDLK